jgi:hypothetical protein
VPSFVFLLDTIRLAASSVLLAIPIPSHLLCPTTRGATIQNSTFVSALAQCSLTGTPMVLSAAVLVAHPICQACRARQTCIQAEQASQTFCPRPALASSRCCVHQRRWVTLSACLVTCLAFLVLRSVAVRQAVSAQHRRYPTTPITQADTISTGRRLLQPHDTP